MVNTPLPAYLSPEEFVSGCLAGLASVIARMDPADQDRANAAMDVHAAARLLGGPVTAQAAHAAEDRLRTLLVELLPAGERAAFLAGDMPADILADAVSVAARAWDEWIAPGDRVGGAV